MSSPPEQTFQTANFLPIAPAPNPTGFMLPPPPPRLPVRCIPPSTVLAIPPPPPPPLPPPPPANLPPPPPPPPSGFALNNWSNPTTTYTRVTVEDLFAINPVSGTASTSRQSARTQLNPNANPFQPAYQRSHAPQSFEQCQRARGGAQPTTTSTTQQVLEKASATTTVKFVASQSNSAPILDQLFQNNLPNTSFTHQSFISRGTTYFGQSSSVQEEVNVVEPDLNSLSEKKPSTSFKITNSLKPVPKRNIAKMMWEAAELYDNALKAIREKRAELQKLKEKKKAKEKIVLEFAKSPDDVDMVSIVEDIVQHSQQGATYDKECGKDYKRRPFIYLFQESNSLPLKSDNSCARSREYLPLGEEHTDNATEQEPRASELGGKANEGILTFRRKEVTVDEIANAIVQIENDFFEKYDSSLTISKEALVNVVAKVQRYIIDQLKIGPVDFVSVRLPRSSTRMILKKNRRSRISGKLRKIRHERPIQVQNRRGGRYKNISLKERENGILIYDGKEVTAQVIVRAIAKLIRAIYGRKPPFRISRSALTEVICDKQERVLKVLKQSVPHCPNLPENKGTAFAGTRLPLLDNSANEFGGGTAEIVGKSTKKIRRKIKPVFIRRKLSESEKCPKKKKARKKKPKSKMKEVSPASRGEPIKGGFVDLDEVTPTRRSLVAAEDHAESEENQSDKELKPSERGRQDKTAIYEEEESSSKLKLRKPEGSDSSAESKATHGKTTWSYLHRRSVLRSRTERQIYNSSRYRGRIHRIFATGVTSPRNDKRTSPKKKAADQGSIEEKNSSSTKIEAAPTVVVPPPPRVDYSSIHGRMTAAPTNLIIRTVEKKSKKRTKKGWRKSWI